MTKIRKNLLDFPDLVTEFHPSKNGFLTPKDFTSKSGKKVWWKCDRADDHEWEASMANRTNGSACPYCAGRRVSSTNNLQERFPEIAKQWHPRKNGVLKPTDFTYGSGKKVWWKCPNGPDHEWEIGIYARTSRNSSTEGKGCPYCDGKKVSRENSLEVKNSQLSKEWDLKKNGTLTPRDVTSGSNRKVWWLCSFGHSWKSTIVDRSDGHGCPNCSNQTSIPEIRLFTELHCIFNDVEYRHRIKGWEIDIYIPSLNIGVEYDGAYYHKKTELRDKRKKQELTKLLRQLIRVRCYPLPVQYEDDITVGSDTLSKTDINNVLTCLLPYIDEKFQNPINKYLSKSSFQNQKNFEKYRSNLPSPIFETSLDYKFPNISEQWHPEKNGALRPRHFTPGSNEKVWWICRAGHPYKQSIHSRTYRNSDCPYCRGKKVGFGNSLKTLNPDLASEWHPQKNKTLTPDDVTAGSSKSVWWMCKKGHEWKQKVNPRHNRGNGCPFCSGKYFSVENSLQIKYPDISKEWHPTKNKKLGPNQISAGNKKFKVWWLCNEGHEWQATVGNRTSRGSGCPKCFNLYKRGKGSKL